MFKSITSSRYRSGVGTISTLEDEITRISCPLEFTTDLDPIIDYAQDSKYVLLGEASHGTSEYYTWRAKISQRLIRENGFSFIAVEGDWPDCYDINRYVKGYPDSGATAYEVLHNFSRWPTWMWANWEIVAMVEWLKNHNSNLQDGKKIGFYGLDVYSLWDSLRELIEYLPSVDPRLVEAAKRALRCFEPYGEDVQDYALATAFVPASCESDVVKLLSNLRSKAKQYPDDKEAAFSAEQNAFVVVGAERYYRAMIRGGAESWNVRDNHMADTLDRLMEYHGPDAKGIVWEHNTHVGDARATDMVEDGEVNIGQLVRERHCEDGVTIIGFGGYSGTVIAGREWGAPMEIMRVPSAQADSWEDILHRISPENKMVMLADAEGVEELKERKGHRAIGVVYRPEYERFGNYVPSILPKRYDVFIYFDRTNALHPLHIEPISAKEPETYPWGI